jgi:hypothetical protein
MVKRARIIVLVTGLLLLAGQLASLVHAADHPFHDTSEICVSLLCLEQHDTAVSAIALHVDFPRYADDFSISIQSQAHLSRPESNHARAPPKT